VVNAAGIEPDDEVLEIGAGPGTLTGRLVQLARRVVAVEIDRRLLPRLRVAAPAAEILNRDVLEIDLAVLFPTGGEVVVGNIPYYLSGALLPRLLEPVHSALVVMEVRRAPAVEVPDLGAFFRFVEAVFQFRRKQLRGALARVTGRSDAGARLGELGIDPSRRAETLNLSEWQLVFRALAP
jgi:16S rRNA (adenine1518-N6/adenine1519-N6)-dimethyltransferase